MVGVHSGRGRPRLARAGLALAIAGRAAPLKAWRAVSRSIGKRAAWPCCRSLDERSLDRERGSRSVGAAGAC